MVICNICKIELNEPDEEHKAECPQCGKIWNLTDDNLAIRSDGMVEIKKIVQHVVIRRTHGIR